MSRTSHKTTLQQQHTPALQTSACKSLTAYLGITNTGPQAGLDPFADLAQHAFSRRHDPLTSEAAEASFFVVLADVGLVVPPHRGPQVLRSADGSFSETVGDNAQRGCAAAVEKAPGGLGRTRHWTRYDTKKQVAKAKFKAQTSAFGDGA